MPDARGFARSRIALLEWYEPRRRVYPWRGTRDPYRMLVSEVMLQQTQASRVVPAYRAFVREFPALRALAAAPRREVVLAWAGLGYNRRAVALSEAARAAVREHDGRLPSDPAALRALPGIGPYTAAAVASIAFGAPVAAMDANVRRVVGRVLEGTDEVAPARVRELTAAWLDRARPGDWNQALMDLGREVCRPRPRCDVCPLWSRCRFVALGATASPAPRRQSSFEGSFRQVRGAVVRVLRERETASPAELAERIGADAATVAEAVARLREDGLVQVHRGRVRLAE